MATLLDNIKNKLSNVQKQPQAVDQTEAIMGLQRAKTGKAVGSSGPRVSSLSEKLAGQMGQAELRGIEQQGRILGEQQAGQSKEQAQSFQQQQTALSQQQQDATQQYANQAQSIMDKLEEEGKKLDFEKNKSQLEQLSFLASMADKNYIHNLQQTGAANRISDDLSFKEALQKDIFSDMQAMLKDRIDFNTLMAADEREFKKMMGQMDIETAMELARIQLETANREQIAKGIQEGTSAGVQYYANKGTE